MTKQPPVTLRVPRATRDAVEKLATARGIPRNAAYVEMIQRGLKATGETKALASVAKADAPKLRAASAKAAPVRVSVPVFDGGQRPVYQKGQKK